MEYYYNCNKCNFYIYGFAYMNKLGNCLSAGVTHGQQMPCLIPSVVEDQESDDDDDDDLVMVSCHVSCSSNVHAKVLSTLSVQ